MQQRPPFQNHNSGTRSVRNKMGKQKRREPEGSPPADRVRRKNSASLSPPSETGSSHKRKNPAASGKQALPADRVRRPNSASQSPHSETGSTHKRKNPAASGLQAARRTKSGGARAASADSPQSLKRSVRAAAMVSFAEQQAQQEHTPDSLHKRRGCSASDAASPTPTSLHKTETWTFCARRRQSQ